ncbi:DNA-binding transcriptional regulator, PucR family [Saccharopolyspora antimicrobica]|uniref:DNA-binding PucR family transcriptional regulator n=1 Tax=Saccharopolyspora antimicrobica TaxID=455193 RepID=A0A1I5LXW5_9PSEU|nr:PucR family transcriptional regulator [Saccharopolyspora antimicrobica]RKT89060.1 DNA-binding PucR family transcriptional regulator [Saccharopolyspora antimicrobica]SFP02198.1 DNA-binding transcriptional regulator, PucR family [Saccharopolyspora antimicrobica]
MIDSNAVPLELRWRGEPLDQVLAAAAPELVPAVLARLIDELPAYAELPEEELLGDITRIIQRGMAMVVRMLRNGGAPDPGSLADLREDVLHRAEEGVPIEAVLNAHNVGVRVAWEHFSAQAGPEDMRTLVGVVELALRYLREITAVVSSAYFQERDVFLADAHAAQQDLLSALLTGGDPSDAAARLGVRLADGYAVLDVEIAPHPDESAPGTNADVARWRKLRRFRAELERRSPQPPLSRLNGHGGVVLLAADNANLRVEDLVLASGSAAGADVTVGAVTASVPGIPEAARTAHELRRLAVAGRPPGVYTLADLALDYQLTRPGPARDVLVGRLSAIEDEPDLLETLRTHFATGLNRRRTARRLHVHPNTVDYRTRKIAELTGLNPADPTDATHLRAALIARTLP